MGKQLSLGFGPEVLRAKFVDGLDSGFAAESDRHEASAAFVEHAFCEDDASESSADLFTLELFR